ncbi:hypothetical protein yc1106_02926 [Curvularia clavata]|uniref:Uncharacterized protein n=1 Tax=Curvularia clavata TaxID=95742 RepID=A0A9Q9DQJ1_CURCL|nr:hypothetical protein yc1106_02926 [Curvularia clavata]
MPACKRVIALFLCIVAAKSDTTTIEIPGIGIPTTISTLPNVAASIISADSTATTFSIKCLEGNDCGVYPKQTQVVGPSTYRIDMEDPNQDTYVTGRVECHVSKSAICTESWSGYQQTTGARVVTQPPNSVGTVGLLITAGVDKLGDAGAKPTGTISNSM